MASLSTKLVSDQLDLTDTEYTSFKDGEYVINEKLVNLIKEVYKSQPECSLCMETLWNYIFQHGIEICKGGKPISPDPRQKTLLKYFMSYCKEFMKCYFILGIVPTCAGLSPTGETIPTIPEDDGFMTVRYSIQERRKIYTWYRRTQKNGKAAQTQIRDKDVFFFSYYGHDPDVYGIIDSPLIAPLKKNLTMTDFFNKCAIGAEAINSAPRIVTEIMQDKPTADPFHINFDAGVLYADRDRHKNREEDRIMVNQAEFQAMAQANAEYERAVIEMVTGSKDTAAKKRFGASMYYPTIGPNLPVNHRVANVPRPAVRHDLLQLNIWSEEKIYALFGVPPVLFKGDIRTVGGVQAGIDLMEKTTTQWRDRLSQVMTELYRCFYIDEICDELHPEFKSRFPDGYSKEDYASFVKENEITLGFPTTPKESYKDMFLKHLMGIMSYPEFVVLSKRLADMPISPEDYTRKPPWDELTVNGMTVASLDKQSQGLFMAKYNVALPEKKGKNEDGGGEKKKKKQKTGDSEKTT